MRYATTWLTTCDISLAFRHEIVISKSRFSRIDVLVIDDWAMAPLAEAERWDFWEICEDRYQTRSTILTSQLPVTRWHEQIGDPTAADGILDRLVHNAHRLEMRGDSMRKKRGTEPPS
jgi:DNA replication protein DnaC